MRESELQYQEINVQGEPLDVYRSVMERTRRCGYRAGTIEPQGQYVPGDRELVIDLYLHGDFAPSFRTEFALRPQMAAPFCASAQRPF
ncbi:hypothetical protein [Caballeronia sp. GAWG2-1]|uniref:hypothetical protein n=1 Tax=Caballeronia sp. GAWG2-1 TaxID=2921744 RepID=UPI002028A1A4|nr:hypothetical protein [Caballeronia sp. GAWG2-1]